MLFGFNPVAPLLLGDGELDLCIIVVNMIQYYVLHIIPYVRGGVKGNFMRLSVSMVSFSHIVRYTNTDQNFIQPKIYGSTGLFNDGVCDLLIEFYLPFVRVMLWMMRPSSYGGDIVLVDNL